MFDGALPVMQGGFFTIKNTAHLINRCQYHIVFAPKHRTKNILYVEKGYGEILRKLRKQKKEKIIETDACPDHIHI